MRVLAAGRLHRQKDYPTLLKAFSIVRHRMDAELVILGEGSELDRLQALASGLGIAGILISSGL